MRYLIHRHARTFDHLHHETVDDLRTATALLLPNERDSTATGGQTHRGCVRYANVEAQRMQRIWALLDDGSKVSLDPEDLMDILLENQSNGPYHPALFLEFERSITRPALHTTMAFRLRMIAQGRVHDDRCHSDLNSVFSAILHGRRINAPIGPGFVKAMWTQADPEWFALSACVPGTRAAVPLHFQDAERALASQHATLSFLARLRQELGLAKEA